MTTNGKVTKRQAVRLVKKAAGELRVSRAVEQAAQDGLRAAVQEAVAAGMTMREIAEVAGLTAARIGQIALKDKR